MNAEDSIILVGSWNPLSYANDVFVLDNSLYVVGDILEIVDLTNPNNLEPISSYDGINMDYFDYFGNATVFVKGDYAYISDRQGLIILDVSDRTNPQFISSYDTSDSIRDLIVVENKAYFTDRGEGLTILDLSNPFSPELISSYNNLNLSYSTPSNELAISGDYLYIADGDLKILDISNPSNPQLILSSEISRDQNIQYSYSQDLIYAVEIAENYAYIADSEKLRILDINNPLEPQLIGSYVHTSGSYYLWAMDLAIVEGYIFVVDPEKGLQIININDPFNPQLTSSYPILGESINLAVADNFAYIADDDQGVQIIDITNPELPTQQVNYDPVGGYSYDVTTVRDYAYIADGNKGLRIMNISDRINPQLIGSYDTFGTARGVIIESDHAYVTYYDIGDLGGYEGGLEIIDISNPINPQLIGSYNTLNKADKVAIVCNYAYIVDSGFTSDSGLQIIDISNPKNPEFVSSYESPTEAIIKNINDITVKGNYAYLTYDFVGVTVPHITGLEILDISNPSKPQLVGYWSGTSSKSVVVKKNYAYVGISYPGFRDYNEPRGGLAIVDISNPTNPQTISSYDNNYPTKDIEVIGNYAYLTNQKGVEIIDISDPNHISLIDSYDTLGNANALTVVEEYIYIADGEDNLQILSHDIANRGDDNIDDLPPTDSIPDEPNNIDIVDDLLNNPIYRFQNTNRVGTYLFVAEEERQNIITNFPEFKEEGEAFKVAVKPHDDLIVMNRFQNKDIQGTYLYAGEDESISIRANYTNFIEEGIAFYVYNGDADKGVDFYRFQNSQQLGTYIFVGEEERQNILANFPQFIDEGVAFEALI